ncbi:MAG: bifunctional metallophosphatase/5'-nucleotidase [Candidatus Cryptobacteroides sp.]
MKKLATIILILACMSLSMDARKLVILHMNDTHSHVEPERSGAWKGYGGVIEQAALIDSVRHADGKRNVLLLHAGDFSQGTSYFSELGGDLEIDILNGMGFDAVCLGNHEFDNGPLELARRLSSLRSPVVCSNYIFREMPLESYVKPYTIVKKAGLRVGIVAILTDLSSVVDGDIAASFKYLDPASSASEYASYLRNEAKCDLVICLSHCGYEEDLEIAEDMKDVDIIVGGHSHTFIDESAYVTSQDGRQVMIVQDGCWGLEIGQIDIEL